MTEKTYKETWLNSMFDLLLKRLKEEQKFLDDLYTADRIEVQFSTDMKVMTIWFQKPEGGEDEKTEVQNLEEQQ